MEYKTGDVCVVRFHPAFGAELKRFRPAVVVSGKVQKLDSRFCLIAPLTTNIKNLNKAGEVLVKSDGFLEEDSAVLLWYLRTVDVNRLERKIGRLSDVEIAKMKAKLKRIFELK